MDTGKEKDMTMSRRISSEGGFTFIEVVIAVSLLAVAASIIVGMQGAAIQRGVRDKFAQQAILAERRIMASLEANEDQVQAYEKTGPILDLFDTFKIKPPVDKEELSIIEQLEATLKIEPWEIPEIDPEAMRKITLIVRWGPDQDQSIEVLYFAPRVIQ